MDKINPLRNLFPDHSTKNQTVEKTDVMNTKNKSYEPLYDIKNRVAIKTVSLQVAVMRPDLQNAVKKAFDLAKSGGRELDLVFNLHSLAQIVPKQSDIGEAFF